MRTRSAQAFLRPAILQAILLISTGSAALGMAVAGDRDHCTALVEFALLSAVMALSAGALCTRYLIDVCGFIADYRRFERWSSRLRIAGYSALGVFALVNGCLDVAVPRRDIDWISYPGFLTALTVVSVVALVARSKSRLLLARSSQSVIESLSDDTEYVALGLATLGVLFVHAIAPTWWLDTVFDAVFSAFIARQVWRLVRTSALAR